MTDRYNPHCYFNGPTDKTRSITVPMMALVPYDGLTNLLCCTLLHDALKIIQAGNPHTLAFLMHRHTINCS